jgi:hypothetical protein
MREKISSLTGKRSTVFRTIKFHSYNKKTGTSYRNWKHDSNIYISCGFSIRFCVMAFPYGASGLLVHPWDTPHSVGPFRTSDQPDLQYRTLERDKHPCLDGIRKHNPRKRDHWDRHIIKFLLKSQILFEIVARWNLDLLVDKTTGEPLYLVKSVRQIREIS